MRDGRRGEAAGARPSARSGDYCSAVTEAAGKTGAKPGFTWPKAIRAFLSIAVVAAIFGFAIPRFASYSDVWPILRGLSAAQVVWLVLAQFLSRVAYWSVYMAALPGLRFWPSAVLIQTNGAVASGGRASPADH